MVLWMLDLATVKVPLALLEAAPMSITFLLEFLIWTLLSVSKKTFRKCSSKV
jgi:hypothetical protein